MQDNYYSYKKIITFFFWRLQAIENDRFLHIPGVLKTLMNSKKNFNSKKISPKNRHFFKFSLENLSFLPLTVREFC